MRDIAVKQARLGASIEVTADPLLMLSVFVTLYIGISVLGMTLAQLGLLLFVLNRLNAKVKEFNAGRQTISQNMAGLLLVKEMTEDAVASNTIRRGPCRSSGLEREHRARRRARSTTPTRTRRTARHASEGKAVLHGVSLTIPAGSFTALVGRSGAGKSTLVELLPRLRDVTSGTITFDGTDIKEFDVGTLRKGIGYLTQSAMLFNDTVRDEPRLRPGLRAHRGADPRRARGRLRDVRLRPAPGAGDPLGDRGVRFSGGERQRIALARVLLEDSSVLILDEPTSALDSESETYIQKALAKLHGKKTIIVIAHRLATVIQADQLLVIDEGRVVERGTHDELIATGRVYQRLFESQLLE